MKDEKDDVGELKGWGLENKLYNRGVSLAAAYVDMYDGERIRVAEKDDNSAEFNAAIRKARSEGSLTDAECRRIVDTDMIIKGRRVGDAHPVYVAIEATYSLAMSDIDKVCQTAALIRSIYPDAEVFPALYYMTRNTELEAAARERDVTLMRSRTLT